jgi:Protein of unknown function (DUF1579)
MKTLKFLIAIALLIAPLAALNAQQQEMSPEQQAMMKAYMAAATPGAPHKAMQNLVGTWNSTIKMYDNPAGTPTETKGKSTFTSVMDGRYLQEHAEGNFNGMPFNGYGTYGYDNVTKKYVASWIDSMGTGIMQSTGTSPDDGTTINWEGTSSDPITGKMLTFHSSMKMVNSNEYHFEMNGPGPDGKEIKMMEIQYMRAK